MKKLLLSLSVFALVGTQEVSAQLALENFNTGTLPANWVLISDGHTVSSSAFNGITALINGLNANAWFPYQLTSGNYAMFSTSKFTPSAQADRWLITPSFQVTSTNTIFQWDDYALGSTESMEVLISPTAGTTAASFTTSLYNAANGASAGIITHALNIGAYNGQTVRLAFREHNTDIWGLCVDNVKSSVVPATDLALSTINPANGSHTAYGTGGSNITIGGTVKNNGASTITSFVVKYQQGANPVVSQTFNSSVSIAPLGTYSFTMTTPFTLPSTVGNYPIKMWISATGDATPTNDTLNTSVNTVSFMPTKRLVIEEATGTWCGWCVRGALYMDSMSQVHPNNVSLVAVHNADPMTVAAYDAAITSLPSFSGFPTIVIDRRETDDPSYIFTDYNNENSYFGYADITIGATNLSGNNLTVPITIKPAANLTGDYRLALVVTENRVHSNTSGGTWDQHNYYSGQPNSGNYALPTSSVFGDFHNLPNPIPANTFYYDAVGRGVYPSVNGTAGLLPSSMTAGTNYTQTITATLDPSWVRSNLHAVVMLIDGATGYILNSNNIKLTTSVTNIDAGLEEINVYPNPTSNVANVKFNLTEASNVKIQLIDAVGKVVYSSEASMNSGNQHVTIPTTNIANGLYNVKIQTEKGAQTVNLTVIK